MNVNKLTVYYFSGTGNARNVAHWIKSFAMHSDIETDLIDISTIDSRKITVNQNNAFIGFCCPTHGFNFPPIMFHFILKFPQSKNNKCFIINTRAGMKAGKIFLPGISGMAQYFSALVLKLKGYKIIGMHPIDLPSNWISFHPGIKPEVVQSIYNRREKEVKSLAQKIFSGGKSFKGIRAILIDISITPIAFLYYIVGRFVLAKSFYASKDCNHCNLCIKKCPIQAIKLVDKRPYWTYKCESCMQCMNICPERAIETSHGYTIGIYYLISSVIIIKIYKLTHLHQFIHNLFPIWITKFLELIIDSVLIVILIIAFYRIFHFLLRFRFFERVIVYTSFTKWKFWRRFKIMKRY